MEKIQETVKAIKEQLDRITSQSWSRGYDCGFRAGQQALKDKIYDASAHPGKQYVGFEGIGVVDVPPGEPKGPVKVKDGAVPGRIICPWSDGKKCYSTNHSCPPGFIAGPIHCTIPAPDTVTSATGPQHVGAEGIGVVQTPPQKPL